MEAKSTSRCTPALLVREPVDDSLTGVLPLDGSQSALCDLAAKYLERLSLAEKRAGGRVYTPAHLVTFILEQARYHESAGEPDATLLDPACGGGAFLVAAVVAIAERLRAEGKAPDRGDGRVGFLRAVEGTVWGVDVDPHACGLARTTVARAVAHLSPGPLPEGFFRRNVVEADFLTSPLDEIPPPRGAGLAFVVGNPPYVSAIRISARYKAELRQRYRTAGGRLDLYTVFLERSLALLRTGGTLAMVTPDKYLVSHSAGALRSFIAGEGAVRRIARFRSHKVFEAAATVPCITVVERAGKASPFSVLSCADRPGRGGKVRVVHRYTLPPQSIDGERWDLLPPKLLSLARAIQSAHPSLAEKTVRISAGPATGRDDLYVFATSSAPEVEPELTRPVVRGRDVLAYRIRDPGLSILLPYTFDETGGGRLIDLAAFPKARVYLEKHRRVLQERHCVRVWEKKWFDLHDQAPIDLALEPKLLVPDVANSNRFAVDEGRYLPLHSAYYMLPNEGIDLHFLAAILNSRVSRFLIRLLAPVVKDGFNRYRRQFLAMLPVPDAPLKVACELARAARSGDAGSADELATNLFALADADLVEVGRIIDAAP
jgi:adenine-specific DNA-methyltransferase